MAEHAGKPKVRFAGFTETWEQRKLGDLAEFNPKAELPTNFEYVDLESVVGTELINHRTQTKCTAPSRAQRLAQYGDLFYQLVRPYQKNNYLFELNSENFVFSTGYAQLRPSVDGYFLMSLVQNEYFVQKVLDNCTGTSYPAINVNDLAEINIYTSLKKSEQARIGTFFRQLDRLVTLHQRKRGRLENIKKAMLEKMFPKNGADVPEVRFAGFTEAWEQRKLVSLCEKFTDGDWIEAKDQSNSGVRLIQTGNVGLGEYIDKQNNKKWISKETFERLNCEEVFSGDILISRLPEPAGRACIVPNLGTKMITAVDCTIVRTATQVNPKYLLQYLSSQSYFDEVNTCLAGGTRQRISRSNLATFDVSMPVKYEEQKAIGEFLCGMDHLITLHQRKVALLQNIKKACLEKMFV